MAVSFSKVILTILPSAGYFHPKDGEMDGPGLQPTMGRALML